MRNFISNHWRVISIQVILLAIVFVSWSSLTSKADIISIAVIVEEEKGKKNNQVEALKLYADRINKYGGINGTKELHIKAYFGHNNEARAKEIAKEIYSTPKVKTI